MAIYSLSVKPISRGRGESIVKVAAYQNRASMYDERLRTAYDFAGKRDILFSKIFLPGNAPIKFIDREVLWNSAENAEKRFDGRTGRTLWCALPNELKLNDYIEIITEFVETVFLPEGMCADIAIHSGEKPDGINNNPHVHILLTDRPIDRNGFCRVKNREWNRREKIIYWRNQWEKTLNRAFERNNLKVRVSCESLEVQGIKREPTKHIGRAALEMERRGVQTERGNRNREIIARNQLKREKKLELERSLEFDLSR